MATAEVSKKCRATAKGLFTKARKNLIRVIDNGSDVEIVENRMEDLKRTYLSVQEKHAEYVSSLEREEDDPTLQDEEAWVVIIDKEFDEAEEKKIHYVHKRLDEKKNTDENTGAGHSESIKNLCLSLRKMEEASFDIIHESLTVKIQSQMIADVPNLDVIKEELSDLKRQLDVCKQMHLKFVATLTEIPDEEIKWASSLQEKVLNLNTKFSSLSIKKESKKRSGIRLERIKMPTFAGNIRDYPRFKADFNRQVLPDFKNNEHAAAYTLKSCLSGVPLSIIRNVDDDLTEMWKRLDDKYGKPSKFTDAVMNDIKKMKSVKEGDDRRFVELVDVVESGFRDLERLKLDKEISNSTAVSIIEDKLPRDIRRLWALEINKADSEVNDADKFPSLLKFLLGQKRAIEYDNDNIRTHSHIYGGANYLEQMESTEYNNYRIDNKVNSNCRYDNYSYYNNNDNNTNRNNNQIYGGAYYVEQNRSNIDNNKLKIQSCIIHNANNHSTQDCREYIAMTPTQKIEVIKGNRLCFSCLEMGHRSVNCRLRKKCGVDNCTKLHHNSLHQGSMEGYNFHSLGTTKNTQGACLLQLMSIRSTCENVKPLTVFFDGGATISLITFSKAAMLGLQGMEIILTVTKVGGTQEKLMSYKYTLQLVDRTGEIVEFQVYGIDKISTEVKGIDVKGVSCLFKNVKIGELVRPIGEIDVLIGFEYAAYHPVTEQSSDHLLVMQNRFGKCLGGFHKLLSEKTQKTVQHVTINSFRQIKVEDFYEVEAMGVNCNPRCGGCKCGKCPVGGKSYTLKEERELRLIEDGLTHMGDHWVASYPWTRDPAELPNNYSFAVSRLKSLENRLRRNPEHCKVYQEQIDDMINRKVAYKLSSEDIKEYTGPIYYLAHHEVLRNDSASTPCRIVFDASGKFGEYVLNDFWAKGPDLINNLLGVLLRFREGEVAVTGDIRKMYHAIKIIGVDQHTHRFLWRAMNLNIEPETYVMSSVSFGDRPSGNIAIVALQKTAQMGKEMYPEASNVILKNTYVDDIADSFKDKDAAIKITEEIDKLIKPGGFEIKKWSFSGKNIKRVKFQDIEHSTENKPEEETEIHKILGMKWDPNFDVFKFDVRLNFSPKHRKLRTGPDLTLENVSMKIPLTKRMILSQINGIYDPLGLSGPFTVRAKILMRKLWNGSAKSLGWDDIIPETHMAEWITFFQDLFEMKEISFSRCIKPVNSTGSPSLVIFSDGSNDAFGACAYARWKKDDGIFESNLIASKNRITPLKRMTIVRSELCGAVLAKRLHVFIKEEMRLEFEKEYFIVDSQIVRAMIQKDSYGFNTFVAVRIGEIQENTNPDDWYWVEGKKNISDWLTRGKAPNELGQGSAWQNGMDFLNLPEDEWPLKREEPKEDLPEQLKTVMKCDAKVEETLSSRIDLNRFSNYQRLLRVTARVLAMYQKEPKLSFANAVDALTHVNIERAEIFWYLEAQKLIKEEISQEGMKRLCSTTRDDGVIVVGGRAEKWFRYRYDDEALVLLPYHHKFSRLFAEYTHKEGGHLGVSATVSKIRLRVWIPRVTKMVKSIKFHCVDCKKRNKRLQEQRMSCLPIERLKPAPAFCFTSLDFFGPLEVRGEVNKRSRGKVYGLLFNCVVSRAVYVDIAPDYTTDGFLLVLRRFVSLRGYPSKIYSDPGSQLVAASKELKHIVEGLNDKEVAQFGIEKGLEWKFSPADGPWQNGCSEALVKSVKKAIVGSIGSQVLTIPELQTVCFEAANLINERPIGRHPTDPNDGVYLCPNHLLLGRASSRVPSGPFEHLSKISRRFSLIQNITDSFWRQWTRDFFPSLLINQKWHTEKRNVETGDIVIVQDSKQIRGNWRLAQVSDVFPSDDGRVRRVELQYKNEKPGEAVNKYAGSPYVKIERPIQRIVVIIPNDEDNDVAEMHA